MLNTTPSAKEKTRALDLALQQIEKQFGKGAIMKLGDEEITPIDVIPTGSIGLDLALGVGGVPRGRIVEIYGPESSGKTTLGPHPQRLPALARSLAPTHRRNLPLSKGLSFALRRCNRRTRP